MVMKYSRHKMSDLYAIKKPSPYDYNFITLELNAFYTLDQKEIRYKFLKFVGYVFIAIELAYERLTCYQLINMNRDIIRITA